MGHLKLPATLNLQLHHFTAWEGKDTFNLTATRHQPVALTKRPDDTYHGTIELTHHQVECCLQPSLDNINGVVEDSLRQPRLRVPVSYQDLPSWLALYELSAYALALVPLHASVPELPKKIFCPRAFPEERCNTDTSWLTEYFNISILPLKDLSSPADGIYSLLNKLALKQLNA